MCPECANTGPAPAPQRRAWGRGGLQASSSSQCQSEARQPKSCTDPRAQRGDLQPGARPSLWERLPSSFGRTGQGGTGQHHPTAEGEEKAQHSHSISMLSRSQMTQQKCPQHHSPGHGSLGLPSVTLCPCRRGGIPVRSSGVPGVPHPAPDTGSAAKGFALKHSPWSWASPEHPP